jgi:probable transcriptional regulator
VAKYFARTWLDYGTKKRTSQVFFFILWRFDVSIGQRLREEREKIGLNQTAMGAVGGVRKQAQLKYENNESYPNAEYLAAVAKIGVDIQYVVLGIRSAQAINDEEQHLLAAFRAASPQIRQFMLQGIQPMQTFVAGNVGQQIQAGDHAEINFKKTTK